MPLQLFLQVIGCNMDLGGLPDRCSEGCAIAELTPVERDMILAGSRATSQVSRLLEILAKLKVSLKLPQFSL